MCLWIMLCLCINCTVIIVLSIFVTRCLLFSVIDLSPANPTVINCFSAPLFPLLNQSLIYKLLFQHYAQHFFKWIMIKHVR